MTPHPTHTHPSNTSVQQGVDEVQHNIFQNGHTEDAFDFSFPFFSFFMLWGYVWFLCLLLFKGLVASSVTKRCFADERKLRETPEGRKALTALLFMFSPFHVPQSGLERLPNERETRTCYLHDWYTFPNSFTSPFSESNWIPALWYQPRKDSCCGSEISHAKFSCPSTAFVNLDR